MEILIILGILILPFFNGIVVSGPVFAIAYLFNVLFRYNKAVSNIVHALALFIVVVLFLFSKEGEVGRSISFIIAYIIGAAVSYLAYLYFIHKIRFPKTTGLTH